MNFLGLSEKECDFTSSKFVIMPIPYEETTSYGKGTKKGPDAILKASSQVEFFDEELEFETCKKIGISTLKPINFKKVHGIEAISIIDKAASKILDAGKVPIGLGGEHTISEGMVKAAIKKFPNVHIVHFDAHADMRDEYEGSKRSHACVMRRIVDLGASFTSIGIRSFSKDEFDYIQQFKNNYFFAHKIVDSLDWMNQVLDRINPPVYLTFDVDVFDSAIMPATGTPEPGGLSWYQTMNILKKLLKNKQLIGADIVELAPKQNDHASDFMIAKLVYKIIGYASLNQMSV